MHIRLSLLGAAVLGSLAFSQIANAAEGTPGSYDDRWYVTAGAGANKQDSDRDTENAATYTLGVGKFVNPRWSVDAELNYQNPKANRDEDLNWSQYGISVDARRHWREEGRRWNPYALMGVGYQRSEEEFDNFPNPNSPGQRKDGFASAKLGVGLQGDYQRVSVRGEIYARTDFDRDSVVSGDNRFTDTVAAISLVVPLGPRHTETAGVAPTVPSIWSDEEPAPTEQAPAVTSLRLDPVYFDFDRANLRPEGQRVLSEAASVLQAHPQLRVEVAGHTDSKGTQAYNQGLSERRAQVAYDYLVGEGVNAEQLIGPVGYGEDRPVAANTHEDGSDNPEGRAQNRRTELSPDEE